jgi:hypothetical protein
MGWLFGFAVVFQPLVVLIAPMLLAMAPLRRWLKLVLQGVVPTALLVAIPLAESWRQTTTALLKQPNYPAIDHATPWLALAPVLHPATPSVTQRLSEHSVPGGTRFTETLVHTVAGEVVAAGPGRLIAIALSFVLGAWAYRRRPSPRQIVWLCCVALSLRCVFESVMNPYYLWPPLAIAIVLVVASRPRLVVAVVAISALTWWSYVHIGPWEWWPPMVALLGIVVLAARPKRSRSRRLGVAQEEEEEIVLRELAKARI